MHRIDTPTAQVDKFGAGKNGFTRGNPQTGVPATALDDDYFDSIQEEIAGVVESTGVALDKSNRTQLLTALKKLFLRTGNNFSEIAAAGSAAVAAALTNLGLSDVAHLPQLTGVIGTSRNAKMSVTAASATATFTADELIVQAALGGRQYKLASLNKTINLATTGAGGMDTGAVPANGFVALYAIYNPTTQVSALLAINATPVLAPEVYGGANMPAGYTASALVSVWRIVSSQFTIGYQIDRRIVMSTVTVASGATQQVSLTAISLNLIAPINAKAVSGTKGVVSTSAGINILNHVASTSSGLFQIPMSGGTASANIGITGAFADLPVITPQTIYYVASVGAGTMSMNIDINGYTF